MKLPIKYVFSAIIALFIIILILGVSPVSALEVASIQPADAISYQDSWR